MNVNDEDGRPLRCEAEFVASAPAAFAIARQRARLQLARAAFASHLRTLEDPPCCEGILFNCCRGVGG
jgi:hypothetical protein